MLVLGIETSCDETGIALVDGKKVLSNIVASSVELHKAFGGVVPEVATRHHVEYQLFVLDKALKKARRSVKDIELVSVTRGPGLVGALLIGITLAKAISFALKIPLLGVNHLVAHIYANLLNEKRPPVYPFIGLIISGGHTSLYYVRDVTDFRLLGETSDDAIGESYDKVSKMLGFGYPGGPLIEKSAKGGDPFAIDFPVAELQGTHNFSFSGVKTAVLYYIKKKKEAGKRLTSKDIKNISASFQQSVNGIVIKKTLACCKEKKVSRVVVGGGVSANQNLRNRLIAASRVEGINVFFPEMKFCLDNGAMVAILGEELYKKGIRSNLSLTAEPNLVI